MIDVVPFAPAKLVGSLTLFVFTLMSLLGIVPARTAFAGSCEDDVWEACNSHCGGQGSQCLSQCVCMGVCTDCEGKSFVQCLDECS